MSIDIEPHQHKDLAENMQKALPKLWFYIKSHFFLDAFTTWKAQSLGFDSVVPNQPCSIFWYVEFLFMSALHLKRVIPKTTRGKCYTCRVSSANRPSWNLMFKTNLAFLAVREGGAEGIICKTESEVQVQLGILVLGGGWWHKTSFCEIWSVSPKWHLQGEMSKPSNLALTFWTQSPCCASQSPCLRLIIIVSRL